MSRLRLIRRKDRGVSQAVTAIVLIAVAIVVALGVGGTVFGLFGTYQPGMQAQITIKDATLVASSGALTIPFSNTGGGVVAVTAVNIPGSGYTYTVGGTTTIPANAAAWTGTTFTPSAGPSQLTAGQTVTLSVELANGITMTHTVTAS